MGDNKKINVCHLISGDLWAGAEIATFTLVDALRVCPELALSVIVLNEGKLAAKLREIGVNTVVIDESKYSFYGIAGQIRKALGKNRIDILHAHRYKENILGAIVKKPCGIKALVRTVHGASEPFKGLRRARAIIYTALSAFYTSRNFEKIIAVSDEIRADLLRRFDSNRVVTIHNAVNTAEIKISRNPEEIKRELGIEPSAFIIGIAGRMVPVKGLEVFLKMAKLIAESQQDVVFLLVGDGPQRSGLEQEVSRIGLKEKAIFTGFRDDIINVLNCFDILVLSSYHEGIPMVLLEGIALGKAVVATAVGGITEVLENEISGLLVNSGDEKVLAEACLRLMKNPKLRDKFISAAMENLRTEYSIAIQRERVLSLYKEMMENAKIKAHPAPANSNVQPPRCL